MIYVLTTMLMVFTLILLQFQISTRIEAGGIRQNGITTFAVIISIIVIVVAARSIAAMTMISIFKPLRAGSCSSTKHEHRASRSSQTQIVTGILSVKCPSCESKVGVLGLRLTERIRLICSNCCTIVQYQGRPIHLAIKASLASVALTAPIGLFWVIAANHFALRFWTIVLVPIVYGAIDVIVMQYLAIHRYRVDSVFVVNPI